MPNDNPPNSFTDFEALIALTDGLTLAQVCRLTGLESSTIQNWVKRGFVPHPLNKRYDSRLLARIRVISMLRDSLRIEQIGELMQIVNGNTDDTSDDIIAEEKLLSCLIKAAELAQSGISVDESAEKTAAESGVDENACNRLKGALKVMVLAYIAGQYKNKADTEFCKLKEEY